MGVPDPMKPGPSAKVPDQDAKAMARDFPTEYQQGQKAARAGKTFWESCDYSGSWSRYAFQAGWERP